MTRHPVLVPTSVGTMSGIVHEPATSPVGCVVAQHGTDGRPGPNRVWARLADALAAQGLVVFRFDYPSSYENAEQMHTTALQGSLEAITWFRERTGGLDLLLCGRCAGTRLVLSYAAARHDAVAMGLVVPALHRFPSRRGRLRRFGRVMGTADAALRRIGSVVPSLSRERVGAVLKRSPRVSQVLLRSTSQSRPDDATQQMFESLDPDLPVWILLGERDHEWRTLWASERRPAFLARAEVEVAPGVQMHRYGSLRVQQDLIDRVTAWAMRSLSERTRT